MLIGRIEDARFGDGAELATLDLELGRVATARPPGSVNGAVLNARGRVVLPALVDAHVHLDKAFLLDGGDPGEASLGAAIRAVASARESLGPATVLANARRALELLVKNGVTAARAHVEIDPTVGLDLVHLHRTLQAEFEDRIELELVAFPQRGFDLPRMVELVNEALRSGLPVMGGAPYVDADPRRHLDLVFELAARYATPIDLHLDFTDDPGRSLLAALAERVKAHGMQGHVCIGHVTTLAAMPADAQARALDMLAAAGIALVVLPATDLYLGGHGEPGTRRLAPLERAHARGVHVALANNNLANPFAPFGNGNLLQAAWVAGVTRRASSPAERELLLAAVTVNPARLLGLAAHGPTPGAHAHLTIVDATQRGDVISLAPPVLATLRAGRLVHTIGHAAPHVSEQRAEP